MVLLGLSHSVAWFVGIVVSCPLSGGSFLTRPSCKTFEAYLSLDQCKNTEPMAGEQPWALDSQSFGRVCADQGLTRLSVV